ncbi:virulence-associated protein E [Caulobacter sp. FWC2]|nr:toprim domain-containing protein [Caulobacter sp. FWC2]PIB89954.1 virulence-associated protein E [Caulobacter sp. FWC2]
MSLKSIVRALGGDLYAGGRRANIPAPGHSRRDRSVSLLERDGRLIIHTFGDADWRIVRDDLRARGLLAGEPADSSASPRPPVRDEDRARRREVAQALWASGRRIAGTLSERHCRLRGLVGDPPGPAALRHHGLAPLSVYRPGPATRPALLAGVCDPDGVVTAIEITYLRADGHRASALRLARKTVGAVAPGSAVRLDVAAETLLVAEGVFTALSARRRFDLPAWALLSTSNLRAWRPPPGVRRVVIAADRGPEGEASAAALARVLRALGVATRIVLPPPGFGDWNELDAAGANGPIGGQRRK